MKNTKQTAKHTAGEWQSKPANLNPKDPMFYMANVICGGIRVAVVAGVGEPSANANARLIASAPIMLEALERAVYARRNGCLDITEWALIEQAIATAKGE